MKKIGLCLKYQNRNFGSMLQTEAFLYYLRQLSLNFEIIHYVKRRTIFTVVKDLPRFLNKIFLNDRWEGIKKKIGLKLHPSFAKQNASRNKRFDAFCADHFQPLSLPYKGYGELSRKSATYDIVISGSDQLWSPASLGSNYYNLAFCADGVKRVSYASSFGTSYIPWYQKKRTKNYLSKMDCVSVRENSGAKIIFDLTGRNASVVCDPVLLLSAADWDTLIPQQALIREKYVFAYFLGASREYRKQVMSFAHELGLKVVALRHLDQYVKADEEFGDDAPYDIGPAEFLNLIRGAEYIFTDSFHGSCFSILYHKRFLTFNRYARKSKVSKNTRIDSLMENAGIDRRFAGDIRQVLDDIDYASVDSKLNGFVAFSKHYLHEALGIINDTN